MSEIDTKKKKKKINLHVSIIFVCANMIVKPQPCGDGNRKWDMLKYLKVKAYSIALFNVTYY